MTASQAWAALVAAMTTLVAVAGLAYKIGTMVK
jgi:hypothetical protein